jgi:hypothetical protein
MNPINPNHQTERMLLRILGPALLLVGLVFLATGMISFFRAFGGGGSPQYFWCVFVGMPLVFIGTVLCKFAFLGKILRFAAGETAPVGKDTFNYLASETKSGVADISEGFHQGRARVESATIAERIQKLESLKQAGVISQEEFEQQKKRILTEL